jgi:hypothetical protein
MRFHLRKVVIYDVICLPVEAQQRFGNPYGGVVGTSNQLCKIFLRKGKPKVEEDDWNLAIYWQWRWC